MYTAEGFMDKNKDSVQEDVIDLLQKSSVIPLAIDSVMSLTHTFT
jgi:myosin heavy subunit